MYLILLLNMSRGLKNCTSRLFADPDHDHQIRSQNTYNMCIICFFLSQCFLQNFSNISMLYFCCSLPCNHCSNWTWVVEEILAYGNRLRSMHCRKFRCIKREYVGGCKSFRSVPDPILELDPIVPEKVGSGSHQIHNFASRDDIYRKIYIYIFKWRELAIKASQSPKLC